MPTKAEIEKSLHSRTSISIAVAQLFETPDWIDPSTHLPVSIQERLTTLIYDVQNHGFDMGKLTVQCEMKRVLGLR